MFFIPGFLFHVEVSKTHQSRQDINCHDRIKKTDKGPPCHAGDVGSFHLGNGGKDTEHGIADARRQNTEGDQVRQGVNLNPVAHLLNGPVFLCPGNFSVKRVTQSGQHEKEDTDEGMPLPVHADQDSQSCRDQ